MILMKTNIISFRNNNIPNLIATTASIITIIFKIKIFKLDKYNQKNWNNLINNKMKKGF